MNGLRMDELSAEVEVLESQKASKDPRFDQEDIGFVDEAFHKCRPSRESREAHIWEDTGLDSAIIEAQLMGGVFEDIDRTIEAIDRVRQPTDVVSREEGVIRRGPQKTGLSEYLEALKRINGGLIALKKSNLRSSQKAVGQMTSLLKAGSLQLEDLFRQSVAEESKSVEPLHYITKELPFPTFSSQKVNTLAVLNDFLSSTLASASGLQSNAAAIYAEVRGNYLTTSLSSLALATVNTTRRVSTTPYEKGSNGIGMYTSSIEGLFDAEYENICQLFSSSSWTSVYNNTTSSAMGVFKRTIQDLNSFIKQNMATDFSLAYDVIDNVHPASMRLKNKTGEHQEFTDALKPIRQTAQGSFSFILEDVKRTGQGLIALPIDNTVAEITTDTMARLRRIADYRASISGLLVSLGDGNWKRPYNPQASLGQQSFDVGADGSLLFSHFALDVIDQLIHELEQKARTMIKKTQSIAVFMVNNVAFIESSIRRSELGKVLTSTTQAKIEKWRKDAVKMYLEPWKECAAFLMDVTYTKQQSGKGGLSGKEKDGVKDKFKNFNTTFEELVQRHKSYNFPDKDVRTMLAKEIGFVGPLYGRFYDKYKDVMSAKYIKYDRQSLEQILGQL